MKRSGYLYNSNQKYKVMKALNYFFCLIALFAISAASQAQEKSATKDLQNPKYEDMRIKHGRYRDAYLYTLSPKERVELFTYSYYKRNPNEESAKQYAAQEESAYLERIKKWENTTDVQRDSILRSSRNLSKGETVHIQLVTLDEAVLNDIYPDAATSKNAKNTLEVFKGYPVYLVRYQRELTDGEIFTDPILIIFPKTLTDLLRIGFNRAG